MTITPPHTLNETNATHDRICLHVYIIELEATESDAFELFHSIARQSWIAGNISDEESRVFNIPQNVFRQTRINFANRTRHNRTVRNAPLIDGRLLFTRTTGATRDPQPDEAYEFEPGDGSNTFTAYRSRRFRYNGRAEITLNPLRAFAHRSADWQTNEPRCNLQTRRLRQYEDSQPINPLDDNYLREASYDAAELTEYTELYIRTALAFIRDIIERARLECRRNDVIVSPQVSNRINLREVETTWDIDSTDPIGDVNTLEPSFRAMGRDSGRRVYANVLAETHRETNVPVNKVRLARGTNAKLYAKTSNKIRLEVTHRTNDAPHLGGHTFDGVNAVDEFIAFLARCREDATSKVQPVANLLHTNDEAVQHRSPYELIRQVIRAASTVAMQDRLLSCLIHHRSYASQTGDNMTNAIRRLRLRGVIQSTRNRSGVYHLTNEYQQAAEILAERAPLEIIQLADNDSNETEE